MESELIKNAKSIIYDDEKLREFSEINRIPVETAKKLLERLLEKPEIAKEFKEYIFSNERSDDFRGYTAGEEKGYQRGHDTGFAKGTAFGVLGALTLAGLAILMSKK